MLVSAVVAGTGVSLGVFVGHRRTESVENGAGSDVLGGDEEDGLALTLDFLLLLCVRYGIYRGLILTCHDLSDLIVGIHQGLLHELFRVNTMRDF
jgi:hypothetical protein